MEKSDSVLFPMLQNAKTHGVEEITYLDLRFTVDVEKLKQNFTADFSLELMPRTEHALTTKL